MNGEVRLLMTHSLLSSVTSWGPRLNIGAFGENTSYPTETDGRDLYLSLEHWDRR
jgi:hypothetical protein